MGATEAVMPPPEDVRGRAPGDGGFAGVESAGMPNKAHRQETIVSIRALRVEFSDPEKTHLLDLEVQIGESCRLRLGGGSSLPVVTLVANGLPVQLTANGRHCSFERAVNLLRMHLPESAR